MDLCVGTSWRERPYGEDTPNCNRLLSSPPYLIPYLYRRHLYREDTLLLVLVLVCVLHCHLHALHSVTLFKECFCILDWKINMALHMTNASKCISCACEAMKYLISVAVVNGRRGNSYTRRLIITINYATGFPQIIWNTQIILLFRHTPMTKSWWH